MWSGHSCPLPLTLTLLLIKIPTRTVRITVEERRFMPRKASSSEHGLQPYTALG